MNNTNKWIQTRMRTGWILLAAGVLVICIGILAELRFAGSEYNYRIITGLGILVGGGGAGILLHYRAALADPQTARRISTEARDERNLLLRARAGNRAYWVSTGLVYIGLMWASFAANGSLPPLAGDTLWFFLAVAVLGPFGVYVGSILVDQRQI